MSRDATTLYRGRNFASLLPCASTVVTGFSCVSTAVRLYGHARFFLRLYAAVREIRFLMLMHVKDAQMAEMLGVGQEAIRQIRRKIALPEGENLEK